MRKSFVALALLVGAATMLTTLAFAQDTRDRDEGVQLMNARMAQQQLLTKAARLGTSANSDTFFIGHTTIAPFSQPWHVGRGPYRPGVGGKFDGMWDFDTYDSGTIDSMQGWVQQVNPNTRTSGTIADNLRPWNCLDWGNRMNVGPVQGRTPGIVSAWHADNGTFPLNPGQSSSNSWTPLAGTYSAWCGLRAGNDFSVVESKTWGGTGNHINGNTVIGRYGDGIYNTNKNFPGYSNQWDQMLYRDVRVATGGSLTVSFLYETQMDYRANQAEATCTGWFDRDPLSMNQGGSYGAVNLNNFISASAYQGLPVRKGPVDSFMVYVGVPSNPTSCKYTDGQAARPIFDLKRRWFSEVIAVDKPYMEILSTFGRDSVYRSSPFSFTVTNDSLQPMLNAQGAADGGGVIRVVFRSKTNANYADETNTGGSFISTNQGAVRIDQVAIVGCTPVFTTSGFETAGDIDNNIESANSAAPGPAVGQGYALAKWHSTGKPPKLMAHTHPLFGGLIGPGNNYSVLAYEDLCGAPDSPIRQCNINKVIISSTDHDLGEAAGGAIGTPFKENRNGFISPTINLVVTGGSTGTAVNSCGLDGVHVYTNDDWWIFYDMYSGIFTPSVQGNVWGNSIVSYPTVQKNGATVWGDIGYFTGVWSNGDKQCFLMSDVLKPHIFTSNANGIPDSCKMFIFREQRCITWGAPALCSPTDGHYTDNVALVLPPPLEGVSDKISIDIWDWYNDAFPANETPGLPGTAAFDTCGAFIQIARNESANTGDLLRFSIPGDSIYITGQNATGTPMRMDCVFRVYPGPGNYVTIGNKATLLRKEPSSPAPASLSDGSFWGEYMASPGEFSKGTHPAGHWDVNTWNSVRIDTVEINIFPANGRAVNLPAIQEDFWQSTIMENTDPQSKYVKLGITKNRCFLNDPLPGSLIDNSNINCGNLGTYPPTWVHNHSPIETGYSEAEGPTTKEYTKVFPDGLLTAGSHIEYFFRLSHISTPDKFVMCPDTDRVSPQPTGSAWNTDGMRWEGISILPDKWKDAGYGGLGAACMLVVDYADRRGAERSWVGIADSIGATIAAKYGAHNGWHATAAYIAPGDGSHNYSSETDCGTNPAIAIWSHGGQPGTTWDLYNVKAAESSTTGSAGIGSRLASRAGMGLLAGKQSMQGPSPDMLRAYYRMLFLMCGNLNNLFFGAVPNRGSQDIEIVQDFLLYLANYQTPRGIWVMGDGFVEGQTDASDLHNAFLSTNLAVTLDNPSYYAKSGSVVLFPDLIPTSVINTTGAIYTVQNSCLFTNDVLIPNDVVGGQIASTYQNLGACVGCVSGVYAGSTPGHPYVSLTDGWDHANMFSRHGGNTVGRMSYFMDVLVRTFGSVCSFSATPTVDAPTNTVGNVNIDFLGNVGNNPMVAGGSAIVRFGLAKPDRVEVKVYDVTGRLVKTLANRNFQAGEQSLTWDGSNDQGQVVSRGVYFTQVKFINSRFVDAKKVTVLK